MQSVNGLPTWPLSELYFVSGKCCLPESLSRFYECDIVRIDILRAKIDMGPISRPLEIGILIYPEAQLAAVHGLTDIFLVANRFAAVRRLPETLRQFVTQDPASQCPDHSVQGGGQSGIALVKALAEPRPHCRKPSKDPSRHKL
jgi:hypothetical protein